MNRLLPLVLLSSTLVAIACSGTAREYDLNSAGGPALGYDPSFTPKNPEVAQTPASYSYSKSSKRRSRKRGSKRGGASKKKTLVSDKASYSTPSPRAERPVAPPKTLFLSADDSNSQAAPVIVRQRILQGRGVPSSLARAYEFLNYYTFLYPPAKKDSVAIYPELRQRGPRSYSLQVAARSEDRARRDVLPLNFTLLIDSSGSMAGQPTELVKRFVTEFTQILKKGDRFSVVICSRFASIVVDSFMYDKDKIGAVREKVLNAIKANDVTDLDQGIKVAYQLAEKNYSNEFLNRVVLLSDGATNAGELSTRAIRQHSKDSERRGIYLVGVGFGDGFNDSLMNAFTDAGKGAYFFVTNENDIKKALKRDFAANFDIAVKDVRMKMVLPSNWIMTQFHGEQVSTVKSEVIPQHLSPNDQMIYHQVLSASHMTPDQEFTFEVEFRDALTHKLKKVVVKKTVREMLGAPSRQVSKGDAICEFTDMLKAIRFPLDLHRANNLRIFNESRRRFQSAASDKPDQELEELSRLIDRYGKILEQGEILEGALDKDSTRVPDVLGIAQNNLLGYEVTGSKTWEAVQSRRQLARSSEIAPREGYRFLLLSTGRAGAERTKGGRALTNERFQDPLPQFMGYKRIRNRNRGVRIQDRHQVELRLKAPAWAKSFSFDFNFFSAEYPEYVKKNYNDTFYAILEAKSTNQGATTNISFDSRGHSIEVDNNYFQNAYHPFSNRLTGFDRGGSTSWLRTSWPIKGGEEFKLTFSVHDEGDGIYDSTVILDNLKFHRHAAVGNTDPLN